MTDAFRALCAELADQLEAGMSADGTCPQSLHIRVAGTLSEAVLQAYSSELLSLLRGLNRDRTALAQPEGEGLTLQWTENRPPSEECRYDHCIAETPFGRFLITWKGWKEYDSPTVDETPWGDWWAPFHSVDEAKAACQQGLDQRLADCARWGHPTPQPPADGEVAELVEWLRETGQLLSRRTDIQCRVELRLFDRAAELLQHQHPQPVTVSERLPEPSIKVLAHYFNALGKGRTVCAIWVPAKSRSDDADFADDDFTEYNEEDDKFYWPEGWYEAIENWDDLGWVKVDEGEVIYWQPLPKWPATALPLPSGEVE